MAKMIKKWNRDDGTKKAHSKDSRIQISKSLKETNKNKNDGLSNGRTDPEG